MSTRYRQASTNLQTTITSTSSAPSSGSKVSMFANKAGFVIPKNKLSGSLVPIIRGNKTLGNCDTPNEENSKEAQRKTKWGPDLSQDISVRKGRAVAYQIRVDQIIQLKIGVFDFEGNRDSILAREVFNGESAGYQIKDEKSNLWEIEKREMIGEILKLNPSYKAPADYIPLLKEAKVPIPVKQFPDYNFLGLIYGSSNNNQKRLEKETGAKLQVYGIKEATGEKVELIPAEGKAVHASYDELYVHISADADEKVDAAVALIELLISPVSVNKAAVSSTSTVVSVDNVDGVHLGQSTSTTVSYAAPPLSTNQGGPQPIAGLVPASHQGQCQSYPGSWFSAGVSQNPLLPSSQFVTLVNPVSSSLPLSTSNMLPSLIGHRPILTEGSSSYYQNPSHVPHVHRPQLQGLQYSRVLQSPSMSHTDSSRNFHIPLFDSTFARPPLCSNLLRPTWPPRVTTSAATPSPPQSIPAAVLPKEPLILGGSPTGWSQAQGTTLKLPRGHQPEALQLIIMSETQTSSTLGGMVSAPCGHSTAAPALASAPQPQVRFPTPSLETLGHVSIPVMQPSPHAPVHAKAMPTVVPQLSSYRFVRPKLPTIPNLAPKTGISDSITSSATNFTSLRSPLSAARPHQPVPGDFTFQPHQPQIFAPPVIPRPTGQPVQNMLPLNETLQLPQTPPFPLEMHNSGPLLGMPSFSSPSIAHRMNQSHSQMHGILTGNTATTPTPRYYTPLPNRSHAACAGPSQFRTSYASSASQMVIDFPSKPFNSQFTKNNQTTSSQSSGLQQIYDPFSPSSVSLNPRPADNAAKMRNLENDPEYEDLMASVGVK